MEHCLGSALIPLRGPRLLKANGAGDVEAGGDEAFQGGTKSRAESSTPFFVVIILATACSAEMDFRLWQWDLLPAAMPRGEETAHITCKSAQPIS